MIFLSLILLGAISLFELPVDLLPETSYPVLSVTTYLGGYSPLEIESDAYQAHGRGPGLP